MAGLVVDLVRASRLHDLAVVHHHHVLGQLERLFLVVGHQHRGDAAVCAWSSREPLAQLDAHLRVERAERLVEQQHLGPRRQRAREGDALPLPAGELRG